MNGSLERLFFRRTKVQTKPIPSSTENSLMGFAPEHRLVLAFAVQYQGDRFNLNSAQRISSEVGATDKGARCGNVFVHSIQSGITLKIEISLFFASQQHKTGYLSRSHIQDADLFNLLDFLPARGGQTDVPTQLQLTIKQIGGQPQKLLQFLQMDHPTDHSNVLTCQVLDPAACLGLLEKIDFYLSDPDQLYGQLAQMTADILLSMDSIDLSHLGIENLEILAFFDHFIEVDLSYNQLASLAGIGHLQNIRYLYLQSNRLSVLDGVKPLAKLRVLNVDGNQITRINSLWANPELQVLSIIQQRQENQFSTSLLSELNRVFRTPLEKCQHELDILQVNHQVSYVIGQNARQLEPSARY